MTTSEASPAFPCPFCQSSHVALVGNGLVFVHYKCTECSEVWTAMAAPRPRILRPASAKHSLNLEPLDQKPKQKIWRH
jgi:hypothetical protein